VQECLQYLGVEADHFPVRTSYSGLQHYEKMVSHSNQINVHGLRYLIDTLDADHRLLLVDDVFSSGYSMQAVINKLQRKTRQNMPREVKTAAVWYRPVAGRSPPNYFMHQTDRWLVLPYELNGLGKSELKENKPDVASVIDSMPPILP